MQKSACADIPACQPTQNVENEGTNDEPYMKISDEHFEMAVQAEMAAQVADGYPATNVNRDYLRAAIEAIPEPDPDWVQFYAYLNFAPHFKLLFERSSPQDKEAAFQVWKQNHR